MADKYFGPMLYKIGTIFQNFTFYLFIYIIFICVCMCANEYMWVCVCMYVNNVHVQMFVYVRVHVCYCVCIHVKGQLFSFSAMCLLGTHSRIRLGNHSSLLRHLISQSNQLYNNLCIKRGTVKVVGTDKFLHETFILKLKDNKEKLCQNVVFYHYFNT